MKNTLQTLEEYIIRLNQTIREDFPYIEEIRLADQIGFHDAPIQRLIMLDRYALKDFTLLSLNLGDLVVITIKDDPKYPQRGYGFVKSIGKDHVDVELDEFYGGEVIRRGKNFVDKPLELYIEQIARRVGRGVAEAEESAVRQHWQTVFTQLISNLDLVPAGRIWFGAGNPAAVTWLNCFVIESPQDSRRGIAKHAADHMDIMATGGGVGSNMSTLRPRKARVMSVNGTSSGTVSWTNYIAQLTNLIQQGGSRRGAQMKGLNDTHPEVILFAMCKIQNPDRLRAIAKRFADHPEIAETALSLIDPKDPSRVVDPQFMTGANISVCVSHEFMKAVEDNEEWTFLFPDIENYTPEEKKAYDEEWHKTGGDVRVWRDKGYALKEYGKIPARVLYDLFMYCAWASAEPGFLYYDNARDMANSWYYAPPIVTNPCGEQWLPAWATCCLSAINFANMYDEETHDVDWGRLDFAITAGIRFLDNVLTMTHYPLPEIEEMCLNERRVGLGEMGLADLMIKLELKYGSPDMINKLDQIQEFFKEKSYQASAKLAVEKGPFQLYDRDKFLQSQFVMTLSEETRQMIYVCGMRNVCVNTVAPTGTTGSMVGVGTGLEPYYAFEYYRSGRLGEFIPVKVKVAQDWLDAHGKTEISDLPDYFIGAQQVSVEGHALVQATVQKHIDSATSKTCNAPNDMTLQETQNFYLLAYHLGLKGVTIYRDGSRQEAVLSTTAEFILDTNKEDELYFEAQQNPLAVEGPKLEIATSTGEAAPAAEDGVEFESTKLCEIWFENGQLMSSCGTE